MRVLIDLDETCVDLLGPWLAHYNRIYNDHLTRDQITQWNMWELVKPICGKRIYDILETDEFFEKLNPYEGSVQAINELARRHTVYFVSSPTCASAAKGKLRWIEEFYGSEFRKTAILADQKWLIDGDLLIDDKPDTVRKWKAKGGKAIAIAQPYNTEISHICDLYAMSWKDTARAWDEILSYVG